MLVIYYCLNLVKAEVRWLFLHKLEWLAFWTEEVALLCENEQIDSSWQRHSRNIIINVDVSMYFCKNFPWPKHFCEPKWALTNDNSCTWKPWKTVFLVHLSSWSVWYQPYVKLATVPLSFDPTHMIEGPHFCGIGTSCAAPFARTEKVLKITTTS
jgi:hypothetical protein